MSLGIGSQHSAAAKGCHHSGTRSLAAHTPVTRTIALIGVMVLTSASTRFLWRTGGRTPMQQRRTGRRIRPTIDSPLRVAHTDRPLRWWRIVTAGRPVHLQRGRSTT